MPSQSDASSGNITIGAHICAPHDRIRQSCAGSENVPATMSGTFMAPAGRSDAHSEIMPALSGRNDLNSMSTDGEQTGVSDELRRSERKENSYFLSDEQILSSMSRHDRHAQTAAVMAYGMFKQWMRRRSAVLRPDGLLEEGNEAILYETVLQIIETMIFAMRADGRIETDEYNSLIDFCQTVIPRQLYSNIRGEIDRLLTIDLDPSLLAACVRYPEESLDMYLLSAVMLHNSHFLELGYLENLAACLGIDPSLRRNLNDSANKIVFNSLQEAAARHESSRNGPVQIPVDGTPCALADKHTSGQTDSSVQEGSCLADNDSSPARPA